MSGLRRPIPSAVHSGDLSRWLAPFAIALALATPWCTRVDAAPRAGAETTTRPGVWTDLVATPPSTGVVVYDSPRQRWLLLGTSSAGVAVWTLDASAPYRWTPLVTDGVAPVNIVWAEYDAETDQVLMASAGFALHTLSLVKPTWTNLGVGGLVPVWMHTGSTTVHDRAHHRLLVFGGASRWFAGGGETSPEKFELCYHGDLWSVPLDGAPVERLQPAGTPGVMGCAPIALDVAGDRLLVFGGRTGCEEIQQTVVVGSWELSLSEPMQWRELPTAPGSPSFDAGYPTVLQKDGSILVCAGPRSVWRASLGADVQWQMVDAGSTGPPDRPGRSVGLDAAGTLALFHGGTSPFETWTMRPGDPDSWRGFGWSMPPERWDHALVVDTDQNRLLMFGGVNPSGLGDTWQRPLDEKGGWSLVSVANGGARAHAGAAAAYDPVTRRLMLVGGLAGQASTSMFVLDMGLEQWFPVLLSNALPARIHPAFAWDPNGRRLIIIGGVNKFGVPLNDVWSVASDGTCQSLTYGPEPRIGAAAVYDSRANRVVIVGGDAGRGTTEVWALDLAPGGYWVRLYEGTDVGPLQGHVAGYDATMNRVLVYSGQTLDLGASPELLAFRLDDESGNPWEVLASEGDRMPPMMGAMVMDPTSPRAVFYGGWQPPGASAVPSSSTWSYSWTPDGVTAVAVSLVAARAEPGRASLEWNTHAAASADAWVERRTERDDWMRIGSAPDLGGGRRVFEDATVAAGERYGYRLRVSAAGEPEVFGETTWLVIPSALQLSIAAGGAQPSGPRPRLAVTLPAPGDARVDVVDAAGRRVFARELRGMQPGRSIVAVDQPLPAGVYLARVTFGPARHTTKLVVVP